MIFYTTEDVLLALFTGLTIGWSVGVAYGGWIRRRERRSGFIRNWRR